MVSTLNEVISLSSQLAIGSTFAGDYRIESPLAEGGMGAVFVVEQLSTGRKRALKVLQPVLSGQQGAVDRFLREAKLSAKIQSEHVVEVIDAGLDEATRSPFLVMELLDGMDLAAYVNKHGPATLSAATVLLQQLAHALSAAHAAGVIHRDLKPENVFVANSRRADGIPTVKLLDFGIASMLEGAATSASTSHVVGSPAWMAPEQVDAARLRPATDVWAFGLLTFWVLTALQYWKCANQPGTTMQALLIEKLVDPMPPASERAAFFRRAWPLGADFDRWFACATHRDPERRFASMSHAWTALEPILRSAHSYHSALGAAPTAVFASASVSGHALGSATASASHAHNRAVTDAAVGIAPTLYSAPLANTTSPHTRATSSQATVAKWAGPSVAVLALTVVVGSLANRKSSQEHQFEREQRSGASSDQAPSAQRAVSTDTEAGTAASEPASSALSAQGIGPSRAAMGLTDADTPQPSALTVATPVRPHADETRTETPARVDRGARAAARTIARQRPEQALARPNSAATTTAAAAAPGPSVVGLGPGSPPTTSRCAAYTHTERSATDALAQAQALELTDPRRARGLRLQAAALRSGLDNHLASLQNMARGSLAQDAAFVQMVRDLEQCRTRLRAAHP